MALIKSKQLDLTNNFDFSGSVTLSTAPSSANDVVNKSYVDGLSTASSAGLDFKQSVTVASNGSNISATYNANVLTGTGLGALNLDGVTVQAGASEALSTRVLIKDQTDASQNGIYFCSRTGDGSVGFTLTRASDANTDALLNTGAYVFVEQGTDNKNKAFVLQSLSSGASPSLGTDDLDFIQFSGAGQITAGTGITKNSDTLNLDLVGLANLSSLTTPNTYLMGLSHTNGTHLKKSVLDVIALPFGLGDYTSTTNGFAWLGGTQSNGQVTVKAGSGVTVDVNGVSSALPQRDSGSSSGTLSTDGSATGITISSTPSSDSDVRITANGVGAVLKGDKTGDCYFSNDSGVNARTLADITSGDELIWNGASGSYVLDSNDIINIFYNA